MNMNLFGMIVFFVSLTFATGIKAEPVDLNNLQSETANENFELALNLCGLENARVSILDSRVKMLLIRAETLEELQAEHRFMFQASSKRVYAQVKKIGVRVVAEIGTIATARGSLCQILEMTNLRGVTVIQGATKLYPNSGSTGSN